MAAPFAVAVQAVSTALMPGNLAGVEVPWNGAGAAVQAVGTALVASIVAGEVQKEREVAGKVGMGAQRERRG